MVALLLAPFLPSRNFSISIEELFVLGVFVAPVFETLLLQSAPIGIARLCGAKSGVQALSSIVPFFLGHLTEGVGTGLVAGLVGGFYYAVTYIRWRRVSWWSAFWVTAVSHGIHNLLLLSVMMVGQ